MPNRTSIAWTDRTSNPLVAIDRETGKRGWFCTKVSAGCAHCYSEKLNMRFGNRLAFTEANRGRVEWRLNERELEAIRRMRGTQRIFMEDMGDLFHEDIPPDFIFTVLRVIATQSRHTFQVLTKRPERMRHVMARAYLRVLEPWGGPLPNLWLGVSVENQARADERIPLLLDTPAAVRFVSAEPLLGPLNIKPWLPKTRTVFGRKVVYEGGLDWVIVGGESGGPPERRLVERCGDWENGHSKGASQCYRSCPMCDGTGWRPKPEALERVRDIRDQCQAADVPLWFKQWGPRAGQGTLVDGREHKEMPRQEVRA